MKSAQSIGVFLTAVLVLSVLICQSESRAEDRDWKITVRSGYQGRADLNRNEGTVETTTSGVELGFKDLSLSYDHMSLGWSDTDDLPFEDKSKNPVSDLHLLGLRGRHEGMFTRRLGYMVLGGVYSGFEEQTTGSLGLAAGGSLVWAIDQKWRIVLGAMAVGNKVDVLAFPLLGVSWNQGAGRGLSFSLGFPRTQAAYRVNQKWRFRLACAWDTLSYRLADDSPILEGGYLETQAARMGLLADYSPLPGLEITAGPEFLFYRRFTVYHDNGDLHDHYRLDNTLGARISLSYAF